MELSYSEFTVRVKRLKARVARTCERHGRDPREVRILPVTKGHDERAVEYAWRCGFGSVGENRVQEARSKRETVAVSARWELIGHLQTNKARMAVEVFDGVQSVDRLKLVRVLDRLCGETGKRLPILLQVNTGGDRRKFGVSCAEAPQLLEAALRADFLDVEGLMTMAPWEDGTGVSKRAFGRLRELRDGLSGRFSVALPELSMGMTGDLEGAIEEGSTCVRVGTALFGLRPVPGGV